MRHLELQVQPVGGGGRAKGAVLRDAPALAELRQQQLHIARLEAVDDDPLRDSSGVS